MKRSLLFSAVLYAASLTSVHAAQPITEPEFASDIVDRYADHIFYGSGATGMALVVIDGNQRVFRSYGETRPGNNVRPQLDSVIRIASYEQIRATLLSMIDWNEELRSRIGVMNYIHQRTRISRSVVAEVLAALRKDGYIEMNKGKLVAINRLPSEY